MSEQKKAEYFVCEGPALDALRAYRDEIDLLVANHKKLQEDFNNRALEQKKVHEAKLHDLWVAMVLRVGLDPVKTWQNAEYQVETRYLKEGFGAIVYEPISDNAFREIFGKSAAADDTPALTEAPDKKLMH